MTTSINSNSNGSSNGIYLIGKKPKFLNLIFVKDEESIKLFPEDVQKAIHLEEGHVRVDSVEYDSGECIPYGSFIAWEKPDAQKLSPEKLARIPAGYNLWCKSNAPQQLADGILEEVEGRYRQTRIVPLKASFITSRSIPVFEGLKTFPGQIRYTADGVELTTPWGISSCKYGEGFAILYGIYGEDEKEEKFRGCVNGNILTYGTPSFDEYFEVTEDGKIVRTLNELYDELK